MISPYPPYTGQPEITHDFLTKGLRIAGTTLKAGGLTEGDGYKMHVLTLQEGDRIYGTLFYIPYMTPVQLGIPLTKKGL